MICYMHFLQKMRKQFEELERSGAKGARAVSQARFFVDEMKKGTDLRAMGKQTKNGEFRINNCRKYDLGSGFRMVTVQEGSHLYFLYIGTHDACHQWIENHRGYIPEPSNDGDVTTLIHTDAEADECKREQTLLTDEYNDMLMDKIDDKILRDVFSGLCRQTA